MKKIIVILFVCAGAQADNKPIQKQDSLVAGIQDVCWSPDGKAIYFSGMWHKPDYSDFKPENWNIYKYDLETKTTTKFIDSAMYVAVSPSGKQIAVGKIVKGNRDIYIYDSNGKNPGRITSHPAQDFGATFSPDEKQLAFNSKRDGKPEIYVVTINDTSSWKRITFSNGFSSYNPAWSPDGKYIAYYFEKSDHKDQIHIMNLDGSNDKNITNDTLHNYFPNWINSEKISYTMDSSKLSYVVIINTNGKEKKKISTGKYFNIRFSPDGALIAFIKKKENCIEIIFSKTLGLIAKITLPAWSDN